MPGTTAARVTALVMALLLTIGGRPTVAVGTWLNLTFIVTQTTTGQEEEEERHAAKGATILAARRTPATTPLRRATDAGAVHARATSHRPPTLARTPAHRDADLRNGIGTPLRC